VTRRVVVWATGNVGRHAIAGVDARPDLELAGVWTSTPGKIGRDAGELAGLGRRLGVAATGDAEALLALRPDCVVYTAMADVRLPEAVGDLCRILRAGVNVVSSSAMFLQFPDGGAVPAELVEPVREAAAAGGASIFVNGIDPGFANDLLPLAVTGISERIDRLRCMEIINLATYDQATVLFDFMGFGRPLDEIPPLLRPGELTLAWGSVVRQLAAGLGITLDEPLTEEVDRRPADRDIATVSVDIAEGTMAAVRFQVIGKVDGVPRVVLEHCTRTSPEQVPEWPRPSTGDGCYRVVVTGEPMMELELSHHGENGDHNVSGMVVTAQRLVNAVPAVVAAPGGLVTALDLPLVTGRGLVAS
jgi:hypothetical protein